MNEKKGQRMVFSDERDSGRPNTSALDMVDPCRANLPAETSTSCRASESSTDSTEPPDQELDGIEMTDLQIRELLKSEIGEDAFNAGRPQKKSPATTQQDASTGLDTTPDGHKKRSRSQRLCYYQHSERFIPKTLAECIVRLYASSDRPVTSILSWTNGKLTNDRMPSVELIDIYFLLVERLSTGNIRDRAKRSDGKGEITIRQFNDFYLAWKSGASSKECAEAIGRDSTTFTYHQIFAPLNHRDKKLRASAISNTHLRASSDEVVRSSALKTVFSHAERRVIGGRIAFVLFADKLNLDLQNILYDAVPVLRAFVEHIGNPSEELGDEEAPHATPKDHFNPTGAMLEAADPELVRSFEPQHPVQPVQSVQPLASLQIKEECRRVLEIGSFEGRSIPTQEPPQLPTQLPKTKNDRRNHVNEITQRALESADAKKQEKQTEKPAPEPVQPQQSQPPTPPPKSPSPEHSTTAFRLAKEGHTSGTFSLGSMERRRPIA